MRGRVLPNLDVAHLDDLLMDGLGFVRVTPARVLQAIDPTELLVWMHKHGIYQFPTRELCDWLRDKIQGVKAIEIGAGNGAIARELGILATDSYLQDDPKAAWFYQSTGQPTIAYPADVKRQDAGEAVRLNSPHTVIGSWITQKFRPGDKDGNMYGVDEEWVLKRVRRYILIGNGGVHGDKRIMARPHAEYEFPWLISRAMQPELNRIWVWEV